MTNTSHKENTLGGDVFARNAVEMTEVVIALREKTERFKRPASAADHFLDLNEAGRELVAQLRGLSRESLGRWAAAVEIDVEKTAAFIETVRLWTKAAQDRAGQLLIDEAVERRDY